MENSNFVKQPCTVFQEARQLYFDARKLCRAGDVIAASKAIDKAYDLIFAIDHTDDRVNWSELERLCDRIDSFCKATGVLPYYIQ